jgi:hypothetical protein
MDRILSDAEAAWIAIDGLDERPGQITEVVLERALGAQMDDQVG